MKLSLEHYTTVSAWNYDTNNTKGCLQITGMAFSTSLNLTPDEMEILAFELQAAALVCRERAAEELNNAIQAAAK